MINKKLFFLFFPFCLFMVNINITSVQIEITQRYEHIKKGSQLDVYVESHAPI